MPHKQSHLFPHPGQTISTSSFATDHLTHIPHPANARQKGQTPEALHSAPPLTRITSQIHSPSRFSGNSILSLLDMQWRSSITTGTRHSDVMGRCDEEVRPYGMCFVYQPQTKVIDPWSQQQELFPCCNDTRQTCRVRASSAHPRPRDHYHHRSSTHRRPVDRAHSEESKKITKSQFATPRA